MLVLCLAIAFGAMFLFGGSHDSPDKTATTKIGPSVSQTTGQLLPPLSTEQSTEFPHDPTTQTDMKKSVEHSIVTPRTPVVPVTDFFGLGLRLSPAWEVLAAKDDPSTGDRKVVIFKNVEDCGPSAFRLYCSGFVIANMRAAEPKLPYKDGVACNYDSVHDDLGWSPPKVVGKVTVDGVEGEHFTQENTCKLEDGARIQRKGDTLHGWRFPAKGLVIYDSENIKKFSPRPFAGVEQLLQTATWS